jgi:hypothetical protein
MMTAGAGVSGAGIASADGRGSLLCRSLLCHSPLCRSPLGPGDMTRGHKVRHSTVTAASARLLAPAALPPMRAEMPASVKEAGTAWEACVAARGTTCPDNLSIPDQLHRAGTDSEPSLQVTWQGNRADTCLDRVGAGMPLQPLEAAHPNLCMDSLRCGELCREPHPCRTPSDILAHGDLIDTELSDATAGMNRKEI